jgi:hypothetical protein
MGVPCVLSFAGEGDVRVRGHCRGRGRADADTQFEQLDMGKAVVEQLDEHRRWAGGKRWLLLMDGVQTVPVRPSRQQGEGEFVWEGALMREAAQRGELEIYPLKHIYRTGAGVCGCSQRCVHTCVPVPSKHG